MSGYTLDLFISEVFESDRNIVCLRESVVESRIPPLGLNYNTPFKRKWRRMTQS